MTIINIAVTKLGITINKSTNYTIINIKYIQFRGFFNYTQLQGKFLKLHDFKESAP